MQTSNLPAQSDARISADPLAVAVKTIVDVMATDFGERFTRTFSDAEQVRQLKRRLYAKLKGIAITDIHDGYDRLVDSKPSFVPTVPEIVEAVLFAQKQRRNSEKNQQEANRLAELPPSKEISESIANDNLKKIRVMLSEATAHMDKKETPDEMSARLVRLEEKRLAHEALLAESFPKKTPYIEPSHECSVSWCRDAGTISHSPKGGGNFYCAKHFRDSGG